MWLGNKLLLFVVVLCAAKLPEIEAAASYDQAFNYEIALRTADVVNFLLTVPQTPVKQMVGAYEVGLLQENQQDALEGLRKLVYSNYVHAPTSINTLLVGFETEWGVGYVRGQGVGIAVNRTNPCKNPSVSAPCFDLYSFDSLGVTTNFITSFPFDIPQRQWYITAKQNGTSWTPVYTNVFGELVIAFASRVHNTTNDFIGVASGIMLLSDLDNFLYESFHDEKDERVVYVMDSIGLVAASVRGLTTKVVNGVPTRVAATSCGNALIEDSASYILDNGIPFDGSVSVHKGFYVQATVIDDTSGVSWTVVVVRPAATKDDYIKEGSTTYIAICALCSLWAVLTIGLGVWVFVFRGMQLWKAAQPAAMLLILFSNLLCVCSGFVLIGKPTFYRCQVQQWWVSFSITCTCASFLAKMWRVLVIIRYPKAEGRPITTMHTLLVVCAILLVQGVIQIIWSALDPLHEDTRLVTSDGIKIQSLVCTVHHPWGFSATGVLILILLLAGCRLAYLTRSMSSSFAESRALMLTFYHGAFLTIMLILVAIFGQVSMSALYMFVVLAMVWFTATSQAALFIPRLQRQLAAGDYTQQEMRERLSNSVTKSKREPVVRALDSQGNPLDSMNRSSNQKTGGSSSNNNTNNNKSSNKYQQLSQQARRSQDGVRKDSAVTVEIPTVGAAPVTNNYSVGQANVVYPNVSTKLKTDSDLTKLAHSIVDSIVNETVTGQCVTASSHGTTSDIP